MLPSYTYSILEVLFTCIISIFIHIILNKTDRMDYEYSGVILYWFFFNTLLWLLPTALVLKNCFYLIINAIRQEDSCQCYLNILSFITTSLVIYIYVLMVTIWLALPLYSFPITQKYWTTPLTWNFTHTIETNEINEIILIKKNNNIYYTFADFIIRIYSFYIFLILIGHLPYHFVFRNRD